MLHVAYIQSFLLDKFVFRDDFVDFFSFVPNAEIFVFEVVIHSGVGCLYVEIFRIDCAENEASDLPAFAEI